MGLQRVFPSYSRRLLRCSSATGTRPSRVLLLSLTSHPLVLRANHRNFLNSSVIVVTNSLRDFGMFFVHEVHKILFPLFHWLVLRYSVTVPRVWFFRRNAPPGGNAVMGSGIQTPLSNLTAQCVAAERTDSCSSAGCVSCAINGLVPMARRKRRNVKERTMWCLSTPVPITRFVHLRKPFPRRQFCHTLCYQNPRFH
jgi:hypothetical protein